MTAHGAPEPVLTRIGEIQITSSVVWTPAGGFPLRGSEWTLTERWHANQRTPTWAVVLAIVGFCVVAFFSLLFLLVRETVHHGVVVVGVRNGPHWYETRIPVSHQGQVQAIAHQVNYVRSLAVL